MRNERRDARRANQDESPLPRPLSVQLPRSRLAGGGGLNGSPITPSTPPTGNKRLPNPNQTQTSSLFPGINFNNSAPGNRFTPTAAPMYEDDSPMSNRFSMDSTTSTITNSTVTGDGQVDELGHVWTSEQVAIIVRTLEEGAPPPKAQLKNATKHKRASHQPNLNANSTLKFLANHNPAAPPPPTTPYALPHVPPNLIDHWARLLKANTDWPHSTRAIRTMLRHMAEEVAKGEEELRLDSPIKVPARSGLGTEISQNEEIDEEQDTEIRGAMEYEDDDFIISPVHNAPLPNGQRDDARVYKSSLTFQRNEDNLDFVPFIPNHSAAYNRARSPTRPHSPSPSDDRGDTISPTNSHFSFHSGGDGISPTKSAFGITPEKSRARGRYLSPSGLFKGLGTGNASRSRSISPSPSKPRKQKDSLRGKEKPLPPVLQSLQTPSLSPMRLSPRKDQGPMSIFASGSVRRRVPTPPKTVDPTDLMASLDGGSRRDALDGGHREDAQLFAGKSAGRAPIPAPFFSREMMQSQSERQRGEQQGQPFTLGNDAFFSAAGETDREASTISSATGTNPYSSISSISSLFSNGSMRKVFPGLGSKTSSQELSSGNTSRGSISEQANQPVDLQQGATAGTGSQQQPGSIRRNDPHAIQTANKNLIHIPSLPSITLAHTHPHLVEERGHSGRNGMKRSASFSKPADLIKRVPSYGGLKGQLSQQPPEVPPKDQYMGHGPRHHKHKRERSDSSLDFEGSGTGTGSDYDTEDVPPSSAPSSDRITQASPLKAAHAPALGYAWDSSPSPDKITDTMRRAPSANGMFASSRLLSSPSKLMASPTLLPSSFFGRKKRKPRMQENSSADGSGSGRGSSPAREATVSPIPFAEDDAMDVDVDHQQTPAQSNRYNSGPVGMAISPSDTASPMGGITPRPRVMSTPRAPSLRRKVSSDWGVPDSIYERHASAELRSIRQSPIEERREGEPRRKRVKTDELESPPPRTRGGPLGYGTRGTSESRYMSPRAMSDGPARTFYKRSAASKTPPRRTGMPRSPRLLPGGGRTTPARSPKSSMRPRVRSGEATPQATISKATNAVTTTPESDLKPRPRGSTGRSAAHAVTAATISSASKARKPAVDATKPTATATRPGGKVAGSRNLPKREPSFFGAELVLKPQASGTTRFPATSTASISSVLFPGGVPPDQSTSVTRDTQMFDGLGNGEESVIRAGESAASSRRAADAIGKSRGAIRNGLGGSGRSRMTRSVSMLGPGQRPY